MNERTTAGTTRSDLPGCHNQGDDLEEAPANIEEAVDIYVEDIIADGERLPGVDYNGTG